MHNLPKRAMHLSAAAALLGALATAPAGATDWEALDSWGGGSAGGKAGPEAAAATGSRGADAGDHGAEIADAFENLGMTAARARCYGEVLAGQLPADKQQQAAELVRSASDADEVRQNVITGGPTLVGGFTAANEQCPEGMGG
jgi:hypothetical protein